jgi:perosamine synthetase
VTAATIEARLSARTRAIVATHLFGNPCEMGDIVALGRARGIPVIEDSAQALLARYDGRPVGTLGAIGTFSLQQGKHVTVGEGGLVVTNDDALARRMYLFINKAWGYGDPQPDHYFLALNYRMSELHGAVAVAQLPKLDGSVEGRMATAARLTGQVRDLPGLRTPRVSPRGVHTYWKYCLQVNGRVVADGSPGLGRLLKDRGISTAPRYIQKPAFMCEIFQKQRTFGDSRWPFTLARPEAVDYDRARFPGTFQGLEQVLVLPWNERYTSEHVDYIARSIRESVERLTRRSP